MIKDNFLGASLSKTVKSKTDARIESAIEIETGRRCRSRSIAGFLSHDKHSRASKMLSKSLKLQSKDISDPQNDHCRRKNESSKWCSIDVMTEMLGTTTEKDKNAITTNIKKTVLKTPFKSVSNVLLE